MQLGIQWVCAVCRRCHLASATPVQHNRVAKYGSKRVLFMANFDASKIKIGSEIRIRKEQNREVLQLLKRNKRYQNMQFSIETPRTLQPTSNCATHLTAYPSIAHFPSVLHPFACPYSLIHTDRTPVSPYLQRTEKQLHYRLLPLLRNSSSYKWHR